MSLCLWEYMGIRSVADIEDLADNWIDLSQAAIIPADLLLTIYKVDGMPEFIDEYFKHRNG